MIEYHWYCFKKAMAILSYIILAISVDFLVAVGVQSLINAVFNLGNFKRRRHKKEESMSVSDGLTQ